MSNSRYLGEHSNTNCRKLHFIGTFFVFALTITGILFGWSWQWLSLPLVGYGFAWIGHFFFEKNKPATFKYPLWSLGSDFKMFFEILLGKKAFDSSKN
ncbi:MAG: DUF962 domain-containing protein [Flavobacteriaceae bacterium]|nr:DUF962 domain-containing protein [Flavobacteriaceae bacterium]